MSIELPKCACGCGENISRRNKTGPAPRYASATCRKRAERSRKHRKELEAYPDQIMNARVSMASRPTDEQVERALVELQALAFALIRLGKEARPELAWRCEKVGRSIIEMMARVFGRNQE